MDINRLDSVVFGGPHVTAHNSERSTINQLADLVDQLQLDVENLSGDAGGPETPPNLPPNYYGGGRMFYFDSGPELPYEPGQEVPGSSFTNLRNRAWETENIVAGSILMIYAEYGEDQEYRVLMVKMRNHDPVDVVFEEEWDYYYEIGYDLIVEYENGIQTYPYPDDQGPEDLPDEENPENYVFTISSIGGRFYGRLASFKNSAHIIAWASYQADGSIGELLSLYDEEGAELGVVFKVPESYFLPALNICVGHAWVRYEDGTTSMPTAINVDSGVHYVYNEAEDTHTEESRIIFHLSQFLEIDHPIGKIPEYLNLDLHYLAGWTPPAPG